MDCCERRICSGVFLSSDDSNLPAGWTPEISSFLESPVLDARLWDLSAGNTCVASCYASKLGTDDQAVLDTVVNCALSLKSTMNLCSWVGTPGTREVLQSSYIDCM